MEKLSRRDTLNRLPRHSLKLSFEFFPPRTPVAEEALRATVARLERLRPDFFSVTFGAGGSTREKTFETARFINETTGIEAAPHISCVGSSEEELRAILQAYQGHGFEHVVALRGDLPSGLAGAGSLRFASELVAFIRRVTGNHFHIDVACYPEFHPQARSTQQDLENLKRKVDAGANGAITQYFYNADAYFRFLESCAALGIEVPIIPGIMPITNRDQLVRFSNLCGAEIPRWVLQRLHDFGDDLSAIRAFGIDVITRLCAQLLDAGAPGLHIYTMNKAEASEAVWAALDLA